MCVCVCGHSSSKGVRPWRDPANVSKTVSSTRLTSHTHVRGQVCEGVCTTRSPCLPYRADGRHRFLSCPVGSFPVRTLAAVETLPGNVPVPVPNGSRVSDGVDAR